MNFDGLRIPQKISPCPITEAVVECRFDSDFPPEAVVGLLIQEFRDKTQRLERLPILDLPPVIRDNDPNLRFSPHFRLLIGDYTLQIGPKSFSVVCKKDYKGWTAFSKLIHEVFERIKKTAVIKKPHRIGLRYINFFQNTNIFEKTKLSIQIDGTTLNQQKNVIRTEFDKDGYRHILQVSNMALLNGKETGSTIDIDIVSESSNTILTDFVGIVSKAHESEKKLFFGLLTEDFVKTFNPQY